MTAPADVRHALRRLVRAPGFTFGVIAVLAIGIGANAAVFSALDQTVIRPLPFADPDRLAMVWEDFSAFGRPKDNVSPATYDDWKRRTQAFADLAALRLSVLTLTEAGGPPEDVTGAAITANLLPMLGISPLAGRTFTALEEPPGHHVVVLSERLWRRRFGADPATVGRSIRLNDEPYQVIGIMPARFHFPAASTDYWLPIALRPDQLAARNSHYLRVLGRLKPGVSWAAASEDMRAVAAQLAAEHPRTNDKIGITVTPLREEITAASSRSLFVLLGGAACVLLIACANVANLLLARASGRRREIAVRLALGASRGRLIRHLLIESLLLAAGGGLAGLVVARGSLAALADFVPPALTASIDLRLDVRAIAFAVIVTAVTTLAVGLAPALHAASRDGFESMRVRTAGDRRGERARRVLVVAEIAIALVLVAATALLVDTFAHLRGFDPGFESDHLLTAQLVVPFPKYADAARRQQFYSTVIDRVRALPGVKAVGLTSDLPYTSRSNYMGLDIEHQENPRGLGQDVLFRLVSSGYLQTMAATLREGRFLEGTDRPDAPPVVVVNDALARQFWPNESALGHRIDTGTGDGSPLWMTIVGVVHDLKEQGVDYGPRAAVYVPFTQTTIAFFQPSEIAVRTSTAPEGFAHALQDAVWSVDPQQPVSKVRTMDDIVAIELGDRRQMLSLVGAFAGVALVLAALGVYSLLSYVVFERRREIGVRMAVGASAGAVVRGILSQSAWLAMMGVGVGLAGAVATTRWLGSLLFQVSPVDPLVLAGVSASLVVVALAAAIMPARRAARVDPIQVLQAE